MAEVETITEYRVRLTREELDALQWSLQVAINQGATQRSDLIQLQNTFARALSR